MKKIEFKEYVERLSAFLQNQEEQLYYVYGNKPYVLSNGSEFNESYCLENNLEIIRTNHNGGTIISSKNDIYIVFISTRNNNFGTRLCNEILEFLKLKNINASYDGNDIMVDGKYKVAANSKIKINDMYYTAVAFFITADVETIKNVCTKPMEKIPRGLDYYDIDREEVIQFVTNFYKGWEAHYGQM